jgi:hypothetical protein
MVRNRRVGATLNYLVPGFRIATGVLLVLLGGSCSGRSASGALYWTKEPIRIEVNGPTTVRLGEVASERARSVLVFRGHLRAQNLSGHASLKMECDAPGRTDILSDAKEVTGTTGSTSQVVRFTAAPGSSVRSITLNVVVDGVGVVWVGPIAVFGQ